MQSNVIISSKKNKGKKIIDFIKNYNTYLILVLCLVVCVSISPDFLTLANAINIGRQYSGLVIVSLGMLMVILTGGIDLSVGSIVALGSVTLAICLNNGLGMFLSVGITIFIGFILWNGFRIFGGEGKNASFYCYISDADYCKWNCVYDVKWIAN